VRKHGIEFQTMPWNVPDKIEVYHRLLDLGTAGFGTDRPMWPKRPPAAYSRTSPGVERRDHIPLGEFMIQAHRGAGELARKAPSRLSNWPGARLHPRADLRITKDGVIVSFHDNILPASCPTRRRR
jgi:hypothetical protein